MENSEKVFFLFFIGLQILSKTDELCDHYDADNLFNKRICRPPM